MRLWEFNLLHDVERGAFGLLQLARLTADPSGGAVRKFQGPPADWRAAQRSDMHAAIRAPRISPELACVPAQRRLYASRSRMSFLQEKGIFAAASFYQGLGREWASGSLLLYGDRFLNAAARYVIFG